MTQLEKVIQLFDKYARIPLARSAKNEPLVLVQDDHNVNAIVAKMRELYGDGEQWSLQGIVDLVRNLTFAKQLHFIIQPGYQSPAPQAPTAPLAAAPKDTRTKAQRLQDAGERVYSHRASPEDVAARKAQYASDRDRIKKMFQPVSTEQAEFRKKLHDISTYMEIVNGRINRASTNRIKQRMREELKIEYPQFKDEIVQPESERDVRF